MPAAAVLTCDVAFLETIVSGERQVARGFEWALTKALTTALDASQGASRKLYGPSFFLFLSETWTI